MPMIGSYLTRTHPAFPFSLCRLGLATRGGSGLTPNDVFHALELGVNFLNWCGTPDGLSGAVAQLGKKRTQVAVCAQFEARTARQAQAELAHILAELQTDYVDVLTFYYVERAEEWQEIISPGGALEYCLKAKKEGQVRLLGLTSHQRPLAAVTARSGLLDLLMIRYNAAHRGAEKDVFPVTGPLDLPVVVYTCLRWGALLKPTPADPPGFEVPRAPDWYRFALSNPAVAVALMAPENRTELDEDLTILDLENPLSPEEFKRLSEHGQRVRRHAGSFP